MNTIVLRRPTFRANGTATNWGNRSQQSCPEKELGSNGKRYAEALQQFTDKRIPALSDGLTKLATISL
ncbi:hypothetical protein HDG40_006504 [Paraburkholderia sp. JPY158]|uniref:Uncharacterized protein n=1 Tax=Paraburkholderia atlantica TaxID=2654982 RepID=A0A7W8QDA2_PARAM|nr:hypothetical protein [Paraburkholderia atlantica]